jgi:hypothetical protein
VTVSINPRTVTVETNQLIRFFAQGTTAAGDTIEPVVAWSASGGTILSDGRFSAAATGTFMVLATSRERQGERIDTAVVQVVRRQPKLKSLAISPAATTLTPGISQTFLATGYLADGRAVPVGVRWVATGGTIDAGGTYIAGDTAGTYHVIGTNSHLPIADTAIVTIGAPAPPPPPPPPAETLPPPPAAPPPPAPTLESVTLLPATATLAPSATRQFVAYGRLQGGDSVAVEDVVFTASGGTVTASGLFTAGSSAGSYRVIATSGLLADTSTITVTNPLGSGPTAGVPFGPFGLWGTSQTYPVVNPAPFTMSINADSPTGIVTRINSARAIGQKLVLAMTGGSHTRYITDGKFDMAKWKARQDLFNTPTIKAAVAAGLKDGTILGADMLDEPQHTSWAGSITKPMLDEMASYVKAIFPGLPAGTSCRWDFRPYERYKVVDFITTQYAYFFGSITTWRDGALKAAAENGIALNLSFNIINGGTYVEGCPKPQTGGPGDRPGACRMTPEQVRTAGLTLGPAASGLFMWQFDSAFMADPANQQAFRDIGAKLATLPAKSWHRTQ